MTLLSSSKISYREMALLNEAFCFSQINEGDAAQSRYEQALRMFPNSGIAEAALNMLRSARNTDRSRTHSGDTHDAEKSRGQNTTTMDNPDSAAS